MTARKLAATIFLTFVLATGASAECQVEHVTQDYLYDDHDFLVTEDVEHALLFNVTDGSENPIDEEDFEEEYVLSWDYLDSGQSGDLQNARDGIWYLMFEPEEGATGEENTQSTVNVTIGGDTGSLMDDCGSEDHHQFNVEHAQEGDQTDIGEIQSESLDEEFFVGGQDLDVYAEIEGLADTDHDVDLVQTNILESSFWTLTYQDSEESLYQNIDILEEPGETLFFQTIIDDEDNFGSRTFVAETPEVIESEHVEIMTDETDACGDPIQDYDEDLGVEASCEPDANLPIEYEVESSELDIEQVTAEVVVDSIEEEENQTIWSTELSEEEPEVFQGVVDIPTIDTEEFHSHFHIEVTAQDQASETSLTESMGYNSLSAELGGSTTTMQGEELSISLTAVRPFSGDIVPDLELNLVDSEVNLMSPDDEQVDSFNLEAADQVGDSFMGTVEIPEDANTEDWWEAQGTLINQFSETRTDEFSINVIEAGDTFSLEYQDEYDIRYEEELEIWFNITNTDPAGLERNYEVEYLDGLEDKLENETIEEVSYDEERQIEREIEIEEVRDFEGQILVTDLSADEEQEIEIEFDAPDCENRIGDVCVNNVEDGLENEQDALVSVLGEIEFLGVGEEDEEHSVEVEREGNITDTIRSINETDEETMEINGTTVLGIEFDAEEEGPGIYTGTFNFTEDDSEEFLEQDAELEATFEPQEVGLSGEDIDLGQVVEGDDASEDVELENTGDVEIDGLEVVESDFDVEVENVSIEAEDEEDVELEFEDLESESGDVEIEGITSVDENPTTEIEVTLETFVDMEGDFQSLISELEGLELDAEDPTLESTISGYISDVQDAQSDWDDGNYEDAANTYDTINAEVPSIEADIAAGGQEEETTEPTDPGTGAEEEDGGFGILFWALSLLTVLTIGFVLYTSLVPEEGEEEGLL